MRKRFIILLLLLCCRREAVCIPFGLAKRHVTRRESVTDAIIPRQTSSRAPNTFPRKYSVRNV